jgi:hypothetical protein
MPWLRRSVGGLSSWGSGFRPRSVHVRLVLYKVVLWQVFLPVLLFPLSASFHHCSTLIVCMLLLPEGQRATPGNPKSNAVAKFGGHRIEMCVFSHFHKDSNQVTYAVMFLVRLPYRHTVNLFWTGGRLGVSVSLAPSPNSPAPLSPNPAVHGRLQRAKNVNIGNCFGVKLR